MLLPQENFNESISRNLKQLKDKAVHVTGRINKTSHVVSGVLKSRKQGIAARLRKE
jgi:hypothetical protein